MPRDIIGELGEVAGEPGILTEFWRRRLPRAKRGSVFVGAGDSYAAALAAFYASRGECVAVDPYVLASNPGFAEGADVYFVSVSGRTSSNALAAERVERHAKSTTALTAVPESRLGGLVDRVVRLPMSYSPRTPGMLSFSLSLLAVLKMAGAQGPCDFARAMREAKRTRVDFPGGDGTAYFLGNSLGFPVALYAAAKTYEVLGSKAQPESLEEFSHLELFSLARSDVVNGFSCFDPAGLARRLGRALSKQGYSSRVIPSRGDSPIEQLFHAVFVVQLSVLDRARKTRIAEPAFLSSRALDFSDQMIY